jgi:hypothetical protein
MASPHRDFLRYAPVYVTGHIIMADGGCRTV